MYTYTCVSVCVYIFSSELPSSQGEKIRHNQIQFSLSVAYQVPGQSRAIPKLILKDIL